MRQPPKAPPKKTTQGYRTPEEASRAADEAVARADNLLEEWEARSREISQRARQRDLYITTALAAGLGGLAIYEARRTIRERAVAQAQAQAQAQARAQALAQAQAQALAQARAQPRADNRARALMSTNLEVLPHGALPAVADNQEL